MLSWTNFWRNECKCKKKPKTKPLIEYTTCGCPLDRSIGTTRSQLHIDCVHFYVMRFGFSFCGFCGFAAVHPFRWNSHYSVDAGSIDGRNRYDEKRLLHIRWEVNREESESCPLIYLSRRISQNIRTTCAGSFCFRNRDEPWIAFWFHQKHWQRFIWSAVPLASISLH